MDDWRIRQNPIVTASRGCAELHFDPRICQHTRRPHRILHASEMNAADFEKLSDEKKEHFFNVLERTVAALVYFLLFWPSESRFLDLPPNCLKLVPIAS